MLIADTIEGKLKELERDILAASTSGGLNVNPLEFVRLFSIGAHGYGQLSAELVFAEESISSAGERLSYLFNQYLVATLLSKFTVDDCDYNLPASVTALYERELQRIEQQLVGLPLDFYRLSNDALKKDLAILSHRLIPVGAEFACPASGVPRSLLFRAGIGQFVRGVNACLICSGGFKPFLELHAHTLSLSDFNPEGWMKTYGRLAELLKANPHWRGVTSSSWFLDPALAEISPHLTYLRSLSQAGGATMLFSSYDRAGVTGALEKSKSRQKLYESGRYCPAIYTRIWPRAKLIDWSRGELRNIAA